MADILQPGWEDRVKWKLTAAALVTGIGSAQAAASRGRSIMQDVPRKVAGYSGAMALFCAIQEGLRAVRGHHDALNSFTAGVVAGSIVVGHFQGPQYRVLGAVVWGPLCGVAHVLNDLVKPRYWIEDLLVSSNLLNPVVLERRPAVDRGLTAAQAADEVYRAVRGTPDGDSMEVLAAEAGRVRTAEMAALAVKLEAQSRRGQVGRTGEEAEGVEEGAVQEQAEVSEAAVPVQEQQRRSWWGWMKRKQGASNMAAGPAPTAAPSAQSEAKVEAVGAEEEVEEEFDEEDFQAWLSAQKSTPEGLVVPEGAEESSPGLARKRNWFGKRS